METENDVLEYESINIQENKNNLLTEGQNKPSKRLNWWQKSRIVFWFKILIFWLKNFGHNPLYAPGVHLFEAPSGTGKTLLANIVIQNITKDYEFWYTNIDEFQHDKTKIFDPVDLFDNGKQIAKLPKFANIRTATGFTKKRTKGIIFDELNLNFNRRMNKSTAYNNLFIGLMEMAVSHRHQGLDYIYFLSQSYMLNDTQIQQIFKFKHTIYSKKGYSYYFYYKDNKIVKIPKVLFVDSYIRTAERDSMGLPIFQLIKTTKIKVDPKKHLETYNHLGYAAKYEQLPDYDIDNNTGN